MNSLSRIRSAWSSQPGVWFSVVALVGLLWNIVGALQFVNSLTATEASMKGAMMTPEQVAVITALPAWVTLVFGIGVATSLLGSVLMYLRHRGTMPTLIVSLLAFILLSIAYAIFGVFAAIGTQQIVTMTVVVVAAAALVWLSHKISK